MMDNRPIGIFDSGLGGLTAVRALRNMLPAEDIIYFGDTGRVPYGSRSAETIRTYSKQDIAFLLSKDVKAIMAACGTASSVMEADYALSLPVPYIGVIEASVTAAVAATNNNKVAIIGTEATIASNSYSKQLAKINPNIETFSVACPLFVPLVENGYFGENNAIAKIVAEEYLLPLKESGVDTLIMGCTHYPLLALVIQQIMGVGVKLVDPSAETVAELKKCLDDKHLLSFKRSIGIPHYFVSDAPQKFTQLSTMFLGEPPLEPAQKINIEEFKSFESEQ